LEAVVSDGVLCPLGKCLNHLPFGWCRSPTAYFLLGEKVGKAPPAPFGLDPRFLSNTLPDEELHSPVNDLFVLLPDPS